MANEYAAYLKMSMGDNQHHQQQQQQQNQQQPAVVQIGDLPQKELSLYRSSLTTVDHLRKPTMHALFNLAHDLRILVLSDKDLTHLLKGRVIAEMFFEPSTRTQCSFSAAAQRLGASIIHMNEQWSSMKKGETLEDSVRMMSAYSDLVVMRHPEPGACERASRVCQVPLVNAGDGTGEHPTQALLDIFTIREEIGTVNGITITMVGGILFDDHYSRFLSFSLIFNLTSYKYLVLILCPMG